jgi:hypothetical protein
MRHKNEIFWLWKGVENVQGGLHLPPALSTDGQQKSEVNE